MRYCPNCKRDFEDDVAVCAWCEVELVDDPDAARAEERDEDADKGGDAALKIAEGTPTATVYTAFDPIQAAEIESALREAGIPVLVCPAKAKSDEGSDIAEERAEEAPASEEETEETDVPGEEPGFSEERTEKAPSEAVSHTVSDEAEAGTSGKSGIKGFFGRLFGRRGKEKEDDRAAAEETYVFPRRHSVIMLDIIVPADMEEKAAAEVNSLLGIYSEKEIRSDYTEEELEETFEDDGSGEDGEYTSEEDIGEELS